MDDNPQSNDVLRDLAAAVEESSAEVIHDRQKWDDLVANQSPERAALLRELTAFSELWECFDRRQLSLPSDIVEDLEDIQNLPMTERTDAFREINQRLLARLPHADSDHQRRM